MIRLFNAYFAARTILLGASEVLLICLAFVAATVMRFGGDANLVLGYEHGFAKIMLVSGILFLCMYYLDLYETRFLADPLQVLTRLLQVIGTSSMVLALIYFVYPKANLGRAILVMGLFLVLLFLLFWRRLFFGLISPYMAESVAVLGEGPLAAALCREMETRPELGLKLVGYVGVSRNPMPLNGLRCIGSLETLAEAAARERLARLIVAMNDRRGKLPAEELLALKSKGLLIQEGSDFYETITGRVPLDSLCVSSLVFSPGFRVSRYMLLSKRVFSIVVAAFGLALSLPLMLSIWVAVRLDSPGAAIYRQPRVGKDGKLFTLYKFRSMRDHADTDSNHKPAAERDDRVTVVGYWLRRARLDELPQLYNILRGDMYFVGPRPFVPSQEQELAGKIPFYRYRWAVKPGATGWAQVNRGYCATLADNSEKLAYDLFYIKNMSLGLDMLIVFRTIKILLLGRGGR
jgi:sugar transferase (PEP-CTERM system associated)